VTEQTRTPDETQTPTEDADDDVEQITHTTIEGRDEASRHADALAEDRGHIARRVDDGLLLAEDINRDHTSIVREIDDIDEWLDRRGSS